MKTPQLHEPNKLRINGPWLSIYAELDVEIAHAI
jgi:hypothetical protein